MKRLISIFGVIMVIALSAYAIQHGTRIGDKYDANTATTLQVNWDAQEDFTVNAADLTLTAGALGDGNSGVGNAVNRVNFNCQGIMNLSAGTIDVYYEAEGKAGVSYQVHIPEGGSVYPLPNITKIKGTGTGTTAAKIKLLYRDARLIDGTGSSRLQ